jgi:hypothetical protein
MAVALYGQAKTGHIVGKGYLDPVLYKGPKGVHVASFAVRVDGKAWDPSHVMFVFFHGDAKGMYGPARDPLLATAGRHFEIMRSPSLDRILSVLGPRDAKAAPC